MKAKKSSRAASKPTPTAQAAGGPAPSSVHNLLTVNPVPSNVEMVRAMPFARVAEIPSTPPGYVPFNMENPPRLRLIAAERRAEAKAVLEEARSKGPKFAADLGRHAPKVALAAALLAEMDQARAARLKADRYASYCANKEQVLLNDVRLFIDAEKKELLHELEHNPALASGYPHLLRYIEQVGGAISEGMAASPKFAARRKRATPPAPPADDSPGKPPRK